MNINKDYFTMREPDNIAVLLVVLSSPELVVAKPANVASLGLRQSQKKKYVSTDAFLFYP